MSLDPHRRLYLAIIMQAVDDATGGPVIGGSDHGKELERRRARVWLTKRSAWFDELCDYLDLDPERARNKFAALIQATDDNGGIRPEINIVEMLKEEPLPANYKPPARYSVAPATRIISNGKKRTNIENQSKVGCGYLLTHNGETLSLGVWSCRTNIPIRTLTRRIAEGMSSDKVLASGKLSAIEGCKSKLFITHNGETLSLKEWSTRLNIKYATILKRWNQGLPVADVLSRVAGRKPQRRATPVAKTQHVAS